MAHGKNAARDLRYGRRGGGWQETTTREALQDIARARRSATDWPDGSNLPRPADTTACQVCDKPYGDHQGGPCPICGTPLDHHPDRRPTDDEWTARARMAAARQAAREPLDHTDRQALARNNESAA